MDFDPIFKEKSEDLSEGAQIEAAQKPGSSQALSVLEQPTSELDQSFMETETSFEIGRPNQTNASDVEKALASLSKRFNKK